MGLESVEYRGVVGAISSTEYAIAVIGLAVSAAWAPETRGKSLADSTRTRGSTGPFTNGAAVSGRCFSCTLHFPPRS
ncbi:hypothetical protein CA951_36080 [Rhodococcus sp. NCIMB 12038]|nr:hypothetical protein CA951_36080 [Rhodococcus sp. NCIMB 12038]